MSVIVSDLEYLVEVYVLFPTSIMLILCSKAGARVMRGTMQESSPRLFFGIWMSDWEISTVYMNGFYKNLESIQNLITIRCDLG